MHEQHALSKVLQHLEQPAKAHAVTVISLQHLQGDQGLLEPN